MSSSRVEKFRDKLKLPENYELLLKYREKQRINNQAYRDRKLESEKSALIFRKKRAEQRKAQRDKKARIEKFDNSGSEEPFKSKSSLGKAVKRVENILPKNKVKAKEVVRVLASKLDLALDQPTPVPKLKPRKSFLGTSEMVRNFFHLDNVSRQLPGKRDFITIKDEFGTKQKIQKRLMLMAVEEARKEFTNMFPDRSISSSKFHSLRPAHVIIMSKSPHDMNKFN